MNSSANTAPENSLIVMRSTSSGASSYLDQIVLSQASNVAHSTGAHLSNTPTPYVAVGAGKTRLLARHLTDILTRRPGQPASDFQPQFIFSALSLSIRAAWK
jgi:hypothetical protein